MSILKEIVKKALQEDNWKEKYVTHKTPTGKETKVKVKSLSSEEQKKYNPNLNQHFTKKELSLPEEIQQPNIKNEKDFFEQAHQTHEHMLNTLNRGKGLDKVLGAKHFADFEEGMKNIDKHKSVILTAPIKSPDRARQKVQSDYNNDWSKLTDGVRASVVLDNLHDVKKVLQHLRKNNIKIAKKPKNRFDEPTDSGYRDMLLNLQYPNGHIGELQIHTKPMIKAKSGVGHKYYEESRTLEAKAKGTDLNPEENAKLNELKRKSKEIYNKAWDDSKKMMKKSYTEEGLYFEYYGYPAIEKPNKFPVIYKNGNEVIEHNLWKWVTYKKTISETEFKKLMKKHGVK